MQQHTTNTGKHVTRLPAAYTAATATGNTLSSVASSGYPSLAEGSSWALLWQISNCHSLVQALTSYHNVSPTAGPWH